MMSWTFGEKMQLFQLVAFGIGMMLFSWVMIPRMAAQMIELIQKYPLGIRLLRAIQAFREDPTDKSQSTTKILSADTTILPGAALALAHPPARVLDATKYISEDTGWSYDLILGWRRTEDSIHCISAPLVGDVYHTLITGQSRAGKDNLALNAMFGLALMYPPQKVQFCIIDGKGLDFCGFEGKAHTWKLALEPPEIAPAMEALTRERERRGKVLRGAQVSKWESYKRDDLPLLVVYVSELSLLEGAVGKRQLTDWLNQELAAGAAFGIRYIIATQTASNFDTRWRSQISLYLGAFQPSQSQDQPNTGLTTNEIKASGGVPPSELPAPPTGAGVFTCVQGRHAVTVRAGLMDDEQRKSLLEQLPVKPVQSSPLSMHGTLEQLLQTPVQRGDQHPSRTAGTPSTAHCNASYRGVPSASTVPGETDNRTHMGQSDEVTNEEIRQLFAELGSRNKVLLALGNRLRGQKQARLARIDHALNEVTNLRLVR